MDKIETKKAQDAENKKEIKKLFGRDDDKAAKRKHGLAVVRYKTIKEIKKLEEQKDEHE